MRLNTMEGSRKAAPLAAHSRHSNAQRLSANTLCALLASAFGAGGHVTWREKSSADWLIQINRLYKAIKRSNALLIYMQASIMDNFPLKRYIVELLGFSQEEVENLTYKWGNNFQLYTDNTLRYVGEYIHPSPVLCMITMLSSFPGFRQMEPLIEKLANDGYDFNEAVTTGNYCNITKQKYRYMLVILQLYPIQPFGLNMLNMMVQNGLSSFDYYAGNHRNVMELLRDVVRSCYSISMKDNPVYFHRVHTMLKTMIGLGLNDNYESIRDSEEHLQQLPKKSQLEDAFYSLRVVLQESRKKPLSLQELARNATRRTIGGVHFAKRVAELPLPSMVKAFVVAKTMFSRKRDTDQPVEVEGPGAKRAKVD